jgi:hypothetical protein
MVPPTNGWQRRSIYAWSGNTRHPPQQNPDATRSYARLESDLTCSAFLACCVACASAVPGQKRSATSTGCFRTNRWTIPSVGRLSSTLSSRSKGGL